MKHYGSLSKISCRKFLIALLLALPLFMASILSSNLNPYQMISMNAAKLMPTHFKEILMTRRYQVFRGIGDTSQFSSSYQKVLQKEPAVQAICQQARVLQEKLGKAIKFDEIAYEYGILARMVSDINDPTLLDTNADLRQQFQKLLASKHIKIPAVFYGYEDRLLKEKNLQGYLESVFERSKQYRDKLLSAYASGENIIAFADSDDRSPAFGIASLFYSHAVSDVANLWLYVWKEARGDMSGTPFYKNEGRRARGEGQGRGAKIVKEIN